MRLVAFLATASRRAATGNNDPLSTPWREVISLAGVARSVSKASSCQNLRFRDRKSEVGVETAVRMMLQPVETGRRQLCRPVQFNCNILGPWETEVSTTNRTVHPAPATRLDCGSFRRLARYGGAPIGMLFALALAGFAVKAQSQAAAPPPPAAVAQPFKRTLPH